MPCMFPLPRCRFANRERRFVSSKRSVQRGALCPSAQRN
jgi:hypothetical protein